MSPPRGRSFRFRSKTPGLSLRCQYLVVISPPSEIFAAVDRMKEELDRMLGGGNKWRWSKLHITLATLAAARADEPLLVESIRQEYMMHPHFELHFVNYDHFDSNRAVFVDPIEKKPVEELGAAIAHTVRSCIDMRPKEVLWSPNPHMTIAKGLFKRGHFESALKFFEERPYSAQMSVDRVLLLRRGIHPTTCYERVDEFMLLRRDGQVQTRRS